MFCRTFAQDQDWNVQYDCEQCRASLNSRTSHRRTLSEKKQIFLKAGHERDKFDTVVKGSPGVLKMVPQHFARITETSYLAKSSNICQKLLDFPRPFQKALPVAAVATWGRWNYGESAQLFVHNHGLGPY
jgi:hypothetical protein